MSIAKVTLLEGASRRERVAQAGFSFVLSALSQESDESAWSTARRGWSHKGPQGVVPQWTGNVQAYGDDGVWVDVTREALDRCSLEELLGTDPTELPVPEELLIRYATFRELGLVAVQKGSWEYAAALRIDE